MLNLDSEKISEGALKGAPQVFCGGCGPALLTSCVWGEWKGMKRAKAKIGRKNPKRVSAGRGAREKVDLAAIREQIMSLVGSEAVGMVETTIGEVEKGQFPAMKYLFEMIGLYPATGREEAPVDNSLARTLLRRLGLPEQPMLENSVTKDCEVEPVVDEGDTVK